jgi:hypothetical protein
MTEELSRWVWDLLADLIDEERVHPKLYFTAGPTEGYRPYGKGANEAGEKQQD